MIRYPHSQTKYIPSGKQAAVPSKGTAACFYSTKNEFFCQQSYKTAISKSVEKGLSWLRKDKLREKWAEAPTSLVIMLEGQIQALCSRGVRA